MARVGHRKRFEKYPEGKRKTGQRTLFEEKPNRESYDKSGLTAEDAKKIRFFKEFMDLVNNPPKAVLSEEFVKTHISRLGLHEDWVEGKGLSPNLVQRQAENQAYRDALSNLAKKYGLTNQTGGASFNKLKREATVLAYAARDETKRLPKELDREIRMLEHGIKEGLVPQKEALYASVNYFTKAPHIDMRMKLTKIPSINRETFGELDKMATRTEQWIREKIGKGVNPAKAYERELSSSFGSDLSKTKQAFSPDQPAAAKDAVHTHFLFQQAGRQGRLAHAEFDALINEFKKDPHLPVHYPELVAAMKEIKDPDRIEHVLNIFKKEMYGKKDRQAAGERPLPQRVAIAAKVTADKFKGQKLEDIMKKDRFIGTMVSIGRHRFAQEKEYQEGSGFQRRFYHAAAPKKEKKFKYFREVR